jgi:hypothetical protein
MHARVLAPQCRVRSTAALTKKRDYYYFNIRDIRILSSKKRLYFNIHIQYISIRISEWRCPYTALAAYRTHNNQADSHIYIYLYLYVVSPE